jgi:hypothetical protein
MLTDDRSKKITKKLSSEEVRKILGFDTYAGHSLCALCGTVHWMHGPCPQPEAVS